MISKRLSKKNIDNVDVILRELKDYAQAYDFSNMGILDEDSVLYMVDRTVIDASDLPFIKEVQSDRFYISESYQPLDGGKYMVNMFSCPVYFNNKIKYHLVASYYSVNLTKRMNTNALEGHGYTFLMDRHGKVVIFPQHYDNKEYNQLMEYVDSNSDIIPEESGDAYFEYNGDSYYAYFEKMEINDWYLMTCAKESDAFSGLKIIIRNEFMAIVLLWIIIAISGVSIIYNIHRANRRRRDLVFYDSMLGIGNGNALAVVFQKLPRHVRREMYLVTFDIDRFKEFNYIYGEETGNELLKYIVRVFQEEFPEVYLFRYFSDYFITLDSCENVEAFEKKITRLLDRFSQDIESGAIQPFDISAGVRKIEEGESLRRIISDSLIARGTVKGNLIRHYAFYDNDIQRRRVSYMEMESGFIKALREREFQVYYQPKCDIRTGKMIGAEALSRWVKPDGRIIVPGEFVRCFEESRQIILLDEYILKEVCRQMKEMESEGLEILPVSVNLSRIHLRHSDILPKISVIIRESGIDPSKLSFEITESALLEESIPMKSIIDHLHELGCRVEMDDYGIGASNPDALISHNFDILKLDKSFVDRIGDEKAEDIIRSTAHLAINWGMEVLAEGVEDLHQAVRLVELGCSYAQGFYYSKPVPEASYRALLKSGVELSQNDVTVPATVQYFTEEIHALLDGNVHPTYIIDPEHFVVMHCNKVMRSTMGEDPVGGLCYQKMRKLDKPCENCSAMRLYLNGDDSPKEFLSYLGIWVNIQASRLYWHGREYIQITCVDITKQKECEAKLEAVRQEQQGKESGEDKSR